MPAKPMATVPRYQLRPGEELPAEIAAAAERGEVRIVRWANLPNARLVGQAVAQFLDEALAKERSA